MSYAASPHEAALQIWQRRKSLAALVFSVVLVAAVSVTLALPDVYRASTTVIVERQQVSEALVTQSITAELETRIHTIQERVMSRAHLTKLILELGLYPELRADVPMNALVERMRRDVQLQLRGVDQMSGRTTIAFALGYQGRDPQAVARVANTLAGLYITEHARDRERQASRTAAFLGEQLAEAKETLDAQERLTSDFRLRHRNELPQQLEANLAALERLNTQLRLNGEYQLRSLERRERFERQIAEADEARARVVEPMDTPELQRLREELAALRTQYSDQYPDVIRIKGQIAALQQQAPPTNANERPASPVSVERVRQSLRETDAELSSLREQEALLRQAIAGYESHLENAPRRQQELQELSRDYEATKEHYQALLKRYEDAQLAASLEEGYNPEQFRILDPAIPPTRPAAPDRFWLLVMGFIAAAGCAAGAMVAAEKLDTTLHAADELRAFAGVPILAAIRPIVTRSDRRRQRVRVALAAAACLIFLAVIATASHRVAEGNERLVRLTARGAL